MTPDTFLALTAGNTEPAFLLTNEGLVLAANERGSELLGCTRRCAGEEIQLGRYFDPSGNPFPDLITAWASAGVPLARSVRIRRPDGRRMQCRAEGFGVTDPEVGSRSLVLLHVVPLDPLGARTGASIPSPSRSPEAPPTPTVEPEATGLDAPSPVEPEPGGPAAAALPPDTPSADPASAETGRGKPVGKMEAMGNLAAGIAHDFNNLLTVMKVEVELVLEEANVPAQAIDSLLSCHAAILRAESLVGGLLAFSRHQLVHTAEMDLGTLLDDALPRLRTIVADMDLLLERAPEPLPLRVDAEQMEIVLHALVRNAVEASSGQGRIVIRTRREILGPDFVRDNDGSVEGEYGVLEIEDHGTGITPEVEARMFEPFFTTKGRGYGRGLGLAQAFGIVKMLGGYLKVDTAVGEGSTFTVYLPLDGVGDEA